MLSTATLPFGNARFSPVEAILLFSLQAAVRGVSAYLWMVLTRHAPIPILLATAGLLQAANGAPLLALYHESNGFVALCSVVTGVAQGAVEPLMIGFSFLDQWSGHVSVAAKRAALIEPLRIVITLTMTGLVIREHTCLFVDQCSEQSYLGPATSIGLKTVILVQISLSLLCLLLPIRTSLRLPHLHRRRALGPEPACPRSFKLLVLSECLDAICSSMDTMHFGWLIQQKEVLIFWQLSSNNATSFYFNLSLLASLMVLCFCIAVTLPKVPSMLLVVVAALLMFPPMALSAVAMHGAEVLGPSAVQVYLAVAIALAVLKSVATGLLKLRALPSRWSYITYTSFATIAINAAVAFSPILVTWGATAAGFTSAQDLLMRENLLADGRIVSLFLERPSLACIQFAVQLWAVSQLHREGLLTAPSCPPLLRTLFNTRCSIRVWPWRVRAAVSADASRLRRDSRAGSAGDGAHEDRCTASFTLHGVLEWLCAGLYILLFSMLFVSLVRPMRLRLAAASGEEHYGAWGKASPPPPSHPNTIAGKSMYMLMVDRFAKPDDPYFHSSWGRSDWECIGNAHWCGGTIASITSKLDYIQGMGFDCVWITPVIEQPPAGSCWKPGCSTGYHGYWAQNFYAIDHRFGTSHDLRYLSRMLKERGMCLVMDIVLNHVRPIHKADNLHLVYPFNQPHHYHAYGRGVNETFDSYVHHPMQALRYNSLGCYLGAATPASCPGFDPQEVLDGWFYDLADLNQSDPFVRSELKNWVRYMVVSYGVDALRLDTTPYMPVDFLSELQSEVDVDIIGEVTTGNLTYHASFTRDPGTGKPVLAGVLNFPIATAAVEAFCPKEYLGSMRDFPGGYGLFGGYRNAAGYGGGLRSGYASRPAGYASRRRYSEVSGDVWIPPGDGASHQPSADVEAEPHSGQPTDRLLTGRLLPTEVANATAIGRRPLRTPSPSPMPSTAQPAPSSPSVPVAPPALSKMETLAVVMQEQQDGGKYASLDMLANFLDTHDMERVLRRCANDEVRVRNALVFIFFMRGMPVLYYGTEQSFGHEDPRASLWQSHYITWQWMYRFMARVNTVRNAELVATHSVPPRVVAVNGSSFVFARTSSGSNITEAGEIILLLNNRPTCYEEEQTDEYGVCSTPITYCSADGAPLLPSTPNGHVWVDALSGWATTSASDCLTVPDNEPKVLGLLTRGNATLLRMWITQSDEAADAARDAMLT